MTELEGDYTSLHTVGSSQFHVMSTFSSPRLMIQGAYLTHAPYPVVGIFSFSKVYNALHRQRLRLWFRFGQRICVRHTIYRGIRFPGLRRAW